MGKVLVERPRHGSRHLHGKSGKGYKHRVLRELASENGSRDREGLKRMYNGGWKSFSEHLGPLRRFIESNVGRPWDKVYSEICKHIDRGNVVQKHILTHLFQYVAVHVELIDGELYEKPHQHHYGYSLLRGRYCWYVCPKTGLLKRAKPEPQRKRRKSTTPGRLLVWMSAYQFVLQRKDGLQLVMVKPIPEPQGYSNQRPTVFDVLFRVKVPSWDDGRLAGFYGKKVYAVAVRTLRQAELKDLPVTLPGKLKAPNVVR